MSGLHKFGFTPVLGLVKDGPVCYVLEVDEYKILLDCGWTHHYNLDDIKPLSNLDLSDVNAVLLSHPDLLHLGALPYAFSQLGLDCPVISTSPVWKLGHLILYDSYQAKTDSMAHFPHFNLDNIDAVFLKRFIKLKPLQEFEIGTGQSAVVITPYPAGHTLGGSVWKISKDTEQIIYGIDYNHTKERHLTETMLLTFERPTLLITDAYNIGRQLEKRSLRDHNLITTALKSLRNGGNVLLPTDAGGRCLELLMVLHYYWKKQDYYKIYSLVFLTYTAKHAMDAVKTFLEWMNENCRNEFDVRRKNPFTMPGLIIARSLKELEDKAKQPMVVVASNEYMEGGFSQELFLQWCSEPSHSVILTHRAPRSCLAGKLLHVSPTRRKVNMTYRWKVQLKGEELERALAKRKAEYQARMVMEQESDVESEEDTAPMEVEIMSTNVAKTKVKIVPDFPMFPFEEPRPVLGSYGEFVDLSLYREKKPLEEKRESPSKSQVQKMEIDSTPPCKTMEEQKEVEVLCAVHFVDLEGRSDGKSVKEIIKRILPRKMIIIHGDLEAKKALAEFCTVNKTCNQVIIPSKYLEKTDLTSDTNIWKFVLNPKLDSLLSWKKLLEYEVAHVDGRIVMPQDNAGALVLPDGEVINKENTDPIIVPAQDFQGRRRALYLGDVKLLEVKLALERKGFPATMGEGVLVCGKRNSCRIERKGPDKIAMKGVLCDEYFTIRMILNGLFNLI